MCYLTLLSTSAADDLSLANTPLLRFDAAMPGVPEERYLRFERRWHVRSGTGCSCQLRHLSTPTADFGFCEPVDWFPEGAGAIKATLAFAAIVRSLASRGELVDCVDAWAHGGPQPAPLEGELAVDMSVVAPASFRFFENYRFDFTAS